MQKVDLSLCGQNQRNGRKVRTMVISLACLVASSPPGFASEPTPRHYPAAPTAYRRFPAAASQPRSSTEIQSASTGNAEADIPHTHLLYSLKTPFTDNVIQQAGGQAERPVFDRDSPSLTAVHSGVIPAGGPFDQPAGLIRPSDCGPDCERQGFLGPGILSESQSPLEHVAVSPIWANELSLSNDLAAAWARLRDDTCAVLHPNNLLLLSLAGGGAIALRENADQQVRSYTARHPERWGEATAFLGELGYINVQIPVLLGTYFWSIHTQDEELHDFSSTIISAVTINGATTLIIKAAANTDRPDGDFNGGKFGFPSYHASSSFTIASVLDEYYGHRVGVPAYALAGMIAWSRIDSRDHDLSDVVFGSAMGFVIGKSISRHHLTGDSRVQILPWFEPIGGTSGLQLTATW